MRKAHLLYAGIFFLLLKNSFGQFAILKNFNLDSQRQPRSGELVTDGNYLYGTVLVYDTPDKAAIYKIKMDGSDYTVLHQYSAANLWTEGYDPYSSLTISGSVLYGTTRKGGSSNIGTVYKLNTDGSGYTVLHHFTGGASDGNNPYSGPLALVGSVLYGTTYSGGSSNLGILYKINTDGSGFQILVSFTGNTGSYKGAAPSGGVIYSGGYLYGMTQAGGSAGQGVVYKYQVSSSSYTVLKEFNSPGGYPDSPNGYLTISGSTLYGMTTWDYYFSGGFYNYGSIFKIDVDGSNYTLMRRLSQSDGWMPLGSLVLNGSNLYGYTNDGGSSNGGTLFQISKDSPYTFTKLIDFTGTSGSYPGDGPSYNAPLISGSVIYATTEYGGSSNYGTIYRYVLTPFSQASDVVFSNVKSAQFTASFTNGSGGARAVFVKAASSGTASPVNGTTYSANPGFGLGTQIGSSGWYCVYNGTSSSVTVTNLSPNTQYQVMVCEYAGPAGSEQYHTGTTTGNPLNQQTYKVWIGLSNNWDSGSNWTGGAVPNGSDNLEITSAPLNQPHVTKDPGSPATCNNLLISGGAVLTIDAGKALTVSGTLTNNAAADGLIIESNGSLKQNSTNVIATVKREIASDSKWHLLSCPMTGTMPVICDGNFAPATANFNSTSGATYDFYKFDENVIATGNVWINLKKSDWSVNIDDFGNPPRFEQGVGYLVEYQPGFAGSTTKFVTGTLASASKEINITESNNTYNLIGNPFVSSLDWKHADWTTRIASLKEDGGGFNMWIWNHEAGQYGAFNSAGSTGINGVTQYIPPTQGYFVQAKTGGGNLTIPETARVHSSQGWLKSSEIIENTVKLKVKGSANSYSDEILIEFGHPENEGGAAKWWSLYQEAPSLYTVKNNQNYSISFYTNVTDNPIIPLSFKAGSDANYTLTSCFNMSSFGSVKLQDLKTGFIRDFKINPDYSFSAETSDDAARFVLLFAGNIGINDNGNDNSFKIYTYNNTICILNNDKSITKGEVFIYNFLGQLVRREQLSSGTLTKLEMNAVPGYYLVNVVTADKTFSQKACIH